MTTDSPSSETNNQRCHPEIVQVLPLGTCCDTTVVFDAGSDSTHRFFVLEHTVTFAGAGCGLSANTGLATEMMSSIAKRFLITSAGIFRMLLGILVDYLLGT